MNELKVELQNLYSDASKHSVYQNIPDFVSAELGYIETIDESWRSDRPRLARLLATRAPADGEKWTDFGANTGFFTLSLAKQYPNASFTAIEANTNHASFIRLVAQYFSLGNVEVIDRAIGLEDLNQLPRADFLLHLNVLHHAGHDFDKDIISSIDDFSGYALLYLSRLRERNNEMLFQMGSNWGGDKKQPLIDVEKDLEKLNMFSWWLHNAKWRLREISYPTRKHNGNVSYEDIGHGICDRLDQGDSVADAIQAVLPRFSLHTFPGEFYRRPLFRCMSK